jgi:hypothetical protein
MPKKHNTFPRVVVPADETSTQPFETQGETFVDEVQEGLEIAAASVAADAGVTVEEVTDPGPPQPTYEAMLALVRSLEARVADRDGKSVKHAANPSARYKLSATIPDWDGARQVSSLMRILHATGKAELTEPEIFAAVTAGAKEGALSTRQDPTHIFRYYRKILKRNGFCVKI